MRRLLFSILLLALTAPLGAQDETSNKVVGTTGGATGTPTTGRSSR
jgi:hypothetical protein